MSHAAVRAEDALRPVVVCPADWSTPAGLTSLSLAGLEDDRRPGSVWTKARLGGMPRWTARGNVAGRAPVGGEASHEATLHGSEQAPLPECSWRIVDCDHHIR